MQFQNILNFTSKKNKNWLFYIIFFGVVNSFILNLTNGTFPDSLFYSSNRGFKKEKIERN